MLRFEHTGHEGWINVVYAVNGDESCIAQLIKQNGKWGVQSLDFRIENTAWLRQIADELDRLNK